MVTRTKKIFVGGLSAPTTLEDVKSYFEQFGPVSVVHTPNKRSIIALLYGCDDMRVRPCDWRVYAFVRCRPETNRRPHARTKRPDTHSAGCQFAVSDGTVVAATPATPPTPHPIRSTKRITRCARIVACATANRHSVCDHVRVCVCTLKAQAPATSAYIVRTQMHVPRMTPCVRMAWHCCRN